MVETILKERLNGLLRKTVRLHFTDRLLSFLLINTALWLLLLSSMLLFNISLFTMNLIQFIGLSLFPLFLLLPDPPERFRFKQTIRSIDENCLIESYLESAGPAQRQFMESSLRSLLEKKLKQKLKLFRLSELNKGLLFCLLLSFILFQALFLINFKALSGSLSAQELKTKTVERVTLKQMEKIPIHQEQVLEETAGFPEPSEAESPTVSGNSVQPEGLKAPVETLKEPGLEQERGKSPSQSKITEQPFTELTGKGPGEPGRNGSSTSISESQPGEVGSEGSKSLPLEEESLRKPGKSFIESPLKDYTPAPESVSARGDQDRKSVV